MTRRQLIVSGGIAALLILAVLVLIGVNHKEAVRRAVPVWLDPKQPPEGIAPEMLVVTEAASWAANRCRPMAASCTDHTAGRRIRRTYPGTLEESDGSIIRGRASVELGGGF